MKSNTEAADYVASASIQAAGSRYRALVRLVERESGESFWSERFEGGLSDLFDTQDELAKRVSSALRYNALARESSLAMTSEAPGFEARLSRAGLLLLRSDVEEWRAADELIDAALLERPEDSMVHAMKACCLLQEALIGWRAVAREDAEAAKLHAERAVVLNDRSDFAHMIRGSVHLFCEGDVDAAKRACRHSLEINPYYNLGMFALGLCEIHAGEYAEGAARCEKAAGLVPNFESNHRMLWAAAAGWFAAGEYERALENASASDQLFHDVPRAVCC